MAQVERDGHAPGDHVADVRRDVHAADRAARPLDGEDPLGGGGQRVAAVLHRRGARVAGVADERDLGVALAVDGGHDADRLSEPLEHRALLDVDLDVAEHVVARGGNFVDEVAEPRALVVAQAQPFEPEPPGHDRGAEVGGAEAHALLVGEPDHLDVARHALGGLDGDQHAERPVVPAGVDHGVQMRSEHERRPVAAAPDQVPQRILARLEAGLAHPAGDQRVRVLHGGRAEAAGQRRRLLADLREDVAALEHAGGAAQLPR